MRGFFYIFCFFICSTFVSAIEKDAFAGYYGGVLKGAKGYPLAHQSEIYAEVYRGANQTYRMRLFSALFSRSETQALVKNLKQSDGAIALSGGEKGYPVSGFSGKITPEEISFEALQAGNKITGALKRLEIESPTMGMKAPKGAKVLFDGSDLSAWRLKDGRPLINWASDGGIMRLKNKLASTPGHRVSSSAYTREKFGHMKLHLEFKIPVKYGDARNTRGNSGIIFGDAFEIQVLDSFGSEGYWDECGALYRQIPPQVNASLEPGAWQTFDIEYKPAKFEGEKFLDYPRFTVYHNGICVLRDVPVVGNTAQNVHKYRGDLPPNLPSDNQKKNGSYKFSKDKVDIQLQEHGDFVEFRNIWVMPMD